MAGSLPIQEDVPPPDGRTTEIVLASAALSNDIRRGYTYVCTCLLISNGNFYSILPINDVLGCNNNKNHPISLLYEFGC